MELSREDFVEHFKIAFQVRCLMRAWPRGRWRKRRDDRDTPVAVSTVRETLLLANGALDGTPAQFAAAITPTLIALDDRTPKGERPAMEDFAACIYDALAAAGLSVRIGPPLRQHGALEPRPDEHPHLRFSHDVRLRVPAGRRLQALSLMAREIAAERHAWWNSNGYTIFSFATQDQRDRFEAASVEVVNGPELSWDEVVVRVGRVRRVRSVNR